MWPSRGLRAAVRVEPDCVRHAAADTSALVATAPLAVFLLVLETCRAEARKGEGGSGGHVRARDAIALAVTIAMGVDDRRLTTRSSAC
jgi:hypothetical protein